MTDSVSLAAVEALPPPAIIEELDYEAILSALILGAQSHFDAVGVDYTVSGLETDPVTIVLQAVAFRELLLRARTNDAARANLIAFAGGSNLDQLAVLYDTLRLTDETDQALRSRLALAIAGRSSGGPEERYRAVARAASPRVAETAIYPIDGGPLLELAVMATDNDGVPDQALLDTVSAAVTAKNVLLVSDVLQVVSAVKVLVDVVVDVWLLPDGDAGLLDLMPQMLTDAWVAEGGIGFDLNPSWIMGRLHVAGVARVAPITPAVPIIAAPNHAISVQSVTINFRGRQR